MRRDLVSLLLDRYPEVSGYTLICVCEHLNRITKAGIGVDGFIERALLIDSAGDYLARVCLSFQSQENSDA